MKKGRTVETNQQFLVSGRGEIDLTESDEQGCRVQNRAITEVEKNLNPIMARIAKCRYRAEPEEGDGLYGCRDPAFIDDGAYAFCGALIGRKS